jgi:predicted nucleic acid-binding protein
MPPSVVVDDAVLVSAFLFPGSIPGLVIEEAKRRSCALHVTPILIEEVRRSLLNRRLRDRYRHSEEDVSAWCRRLAETGADGVMPQSRHQH